jgi:hypothetical protein
MNSLDSSINKNRSFFVKIEETGLGQLLRFIKNRPVTIQNIQNLRNIEKPKTENSSNKAKKNWAKTQKLVSLPFLVFPQNLKFEFSTKTVRFFWFSVKSVGSGF